MRGLSNEYSKTASSKDCWLCQLNNIICLTHHNVDVYQVLVILIHLSILWQDDGMLDCHSG
jgi:hypothetical protein